MGEVRYRAYRYPRWWVQPPSCPKVLLSFTLASSLTSPGHSKQASSEACSAMFSGMALAQHGGTSLALAVDTVSTLQGQECGILGPDCEHPTTQAKS